MILHHGCFHIRKSADRGLFAAPRSLSQLVTSFIGSWCQGIHLTLLFAWTSVLQHLVLDFELSEFLSEHFVQGLHCSHWKGFPFLCSLFPPIGEIVFLPFAIRKTNNFLFVLYICSFLLKSSHTNVCDLSLIRLSKIIAKPAGSAGRSGWTRTIDLTLIRRAL